MHGTPATRPPRDVRTRLPPSPDRNDPSKTPVNTGRRKREE